MTRVVTVGSILFTAAGVGQDDGGLLQMRSDHLRDLAEGTKSGQVEGTDSSTTATRPLTVFAGFKGSPKGYRCKTQANKVFRLEALTAYNPQFEQEADFDTDVKAQRMEWKKDVAGLETADLSEALSQAALKDLEKLEDKSVERAKAFWWWRNLDKIKPNKTHPFLLGTSPCDWHSGAGECPDDEKDGDDEESLNFQRSQTICTKVAIRPALCKHLCNTIPECEAFGTFDTSDKFSRCCFNNMDQDTSWEELEDWTQEVSGKNNKNFRCYRKNPPPQCPTDKCPTAEQLKQPFCHVNVHCGCPPCPTPEDIEKGCPEGMPEECEAQTDCKLWSDDASLEDGTSTDAQTAINNNYSAANYYGNCRSGWETGNIDPLTGKKIFHFKEKLKYFNSGMGQYHMDKSDDELESHGVSNDWLALKKGCVRNITYKGCRAEAGRLYSLGKQASNGGKPFIDSFDFLWGRHKRTQDFQAWLDGKNRGIDWDDETQGPKYDGITHADEMDIVGFKDYEYRDLPEDLESACCLFKTPDNEEMRGAAFNQENRPLWQRKCTVCLDHLL